MISFKQHSTSADLFTRVGAALNAIGTEYNYQVAPAMAKGKPGKNVKTMREYRMQLIDKKNDTSTKFIAHLKSELESSESVENVRFNQISPNSSKFPSYTFEIEGKIFDIVVARGANKGENFEVQTVKNLGSYFQTRNDKDFAKLINLMNEANPEFASVEIKNVKQRTGSTKKEGVPIEKLGAIIGDIILTDTSGNDWFISLKDVNGNTFSSYSGAASLFEVSSGALMFNSEGAKFLKSFGVDLNKVQAGFDERRKYKGTRAVFPTPKANQAELKKIFEKAWGMNYFYVRRKASADGWKVFWLDRDYLDELTEGIVVDEVSYPSLKSKQISIKCHSRKQKYLIEIRNSKAGEYPNDIKFKVIP
jgi:hypothetical protein